MMSLAPDQPVVLIVEDQVLVRMTAHDLLSDAGFHVIEAANGEEALRVLEARPDLAVVISDIEIGGGIDGLELAKRIEEGWPGIGVILVSGRMIPAAHELPKGSVFLAKPYPLSRLVEQARTMADQAMQGVVVESEQGAHNNVVPLRANDA
jgi:CheY-like chemotaxis protein